MSIAELLSDRRTKRAADADAALHALVRRLSDSDMADVDPDEVVTICDAADVTEHELQAMVDDFQERQRLAADVADTTKRRKARDTAKSTLVKADTAIERAEKALLALRDERSTKWSDWSTANERHNDAIAAAARLKRPQFAKFDDASEAAERQIRDRNDTAARERSQELSAARQRLSDAEHALAVLDHQIESQEGLLTHNQQHPLEAAPIRQATERLESLKADRKLKIAAAGGARSKLRSLES